MPCMASSTKSAIHDDPRLFLSCMNLVKDVTQQDWHVSIADLHLRHPTARPTTQLPPVIAGFLSRMEITGNIRAHRNTPATKATSSEELRKNPHSASVILWRIGSG
mmetsp:Transcript_25322/g.49351  ORF Transcript_25322/g.49351 Transcript_25322/m.49351 type:complete len:106 (+) Transcript_25322:492-809(+)